MSADPPVFHVPPAKAREKGATGGRRSAAKRALKKALEGIKECAKPINWRSEPEKE